MSRGKSKFKSRVKWLFLAGSVFFCSCSSTVTYYIAPEYSRKVKSGLEVFTAEKAGRLAGKKAVLITNHSGVDFSLNSNISMIRDAGIELMCLMAPEHGIYGFEYEYDEKKSFNDSGIGLKVYNLHKLEPAEFKKITAGADFLIYDIQDMGMRCYTYITNLKYVIDNLKPGLKLIVLDRPNPVSFLGTDGAYLESKFTSKFISAFPAPYIYGFTPGEAALYYNKEFGRKADIEVIEMKRYSRKMLFPETGLPWVPPSPNLPSYQSAIVYTAVVMLEGVNLSLGRGTAKPFEYIGAPWIEPESFSSSLNELGLKNFRFKPVYFQPYYSKFQGEKCGGAQIFYTGGKFSPTETAYKMISLIKKKYPEAEWTRFKTWYDVDYLAGTDKFRLFINDKKDFAEFRDSIAEGLETYNKKWKKYLLY